MANSTLISYQSGLKITVTTDKQVYKVPTTGVTVQISGNLTLNNLPVSDGLIALQINTRIGGFIYRTLLTGTIPTWTRYIEIVDAYIGDASGNHLTNVKRGATIWIWIWYKNNLIVPVYTVIAFTIYSSSNIPLFGFDLGGNSIPPGGPWCSAYSWQVPSSADLGTAAIYASAFSDSPQNHGVPYCPENSSTFNIISSKTSTMQHSSETAQVTYENGTYGSSFYIPPNGGTLGNYTVYVASYYQGGQVSDSTKFEVKLLGDIYRDGKVDISDLVKMVPTIPSMPGYPNWDPEADLTDPPDNKVDISDLTILINTIGNYGTY
jgi:hypothetical protein